MPEPGVQARLEEEFVTETASIGLPWRLLVFAGVLFGLAVAIFLGLKFGYAQYLDSQAKALDQKINDLARQVKQEDQQNFINFYSQLVNLKKVLDRHSFASNVFNFLERNTLGQVYYNRAEYAAEDHSLILNGLADSPETLIQQLSVFNKAAELDNVVLQQIQFDAKGTIFGLKLTFKENFFALPKQQ
jgi:hypothetical protein